DEYFLSDEFEEGIRVLTTDNGCRGVDCGSCPILKIWKKHKTDCDTMMREINPSRDTAISTGMGEMTRIMLEMISENRCFWRVKND
ncbi:MAG: hypothetical protein ACRDDH_14670, partial [Cetobacterium sp.]|uniref:hypothetical protein n=1 Tax=Cetobacterium sp. TaxID=2071632 RepID=UPI003EE52FDE